MLDRHPGRVIAAVAAVGAVCLVVAGLIGQYNDGPLGGLPEWMGALTWFGFLLSIPVLVLLLAYVGIQRLRHRGQSPA